MAMAFPAAVSRGEHAPTPSTSSRGGVRQGTPSALKGPRSPGEACLAAVVAQLSFRRLRASRQSRQSIQRSSLAVSLETDVKPQTVEVDEELFSRLNQLAAKGQVRNARAVFEKILAGLRAKPENGRSPGARPIPLSMLYGTMLKASANAGDVKGADELVARARKESVPMNQKFYGKLLETASKAGDIVMAEKWFEDRQSAGIAANQAHFACMVEAYAKAGELDLASQWLERTRAAGVGTQPNMFNSLIYAHASRGQMQEATNFMGQMIDDGHPAEVSSFAALALAAAQDGQDEQAQRWMSKAEGDSEAWQVAYAKLAAASGSAEQAAAWLRHMQDAGLQPGVENFSVVLDACAKEGDIEQVEQLMEDMEAAEVTPSVVTYSSAMHAYTKAEQLEQAASMLSKMMKMGLAPDSVAFGTLMDAYAKAGQPEGAMEVAEQMKARDIPLTVREHNSILEAMVKADRANDAARYLLQMPQASDSWQRDLLDPDIYSYTMVMGALASAGRASSVDSLRQAMEVAGIEANPVLHEAVMRGYLSAKKEKDAHRWLRDADKSGTSLDSDSKVVCCAMDVCLRNRNAQEGLHWLQRMQAAGTRPPSEGSRGVNFHITAVEVCAKAGAVDDALEWLQRAETAGLNVERKTQADLKAGKGSGKPKGVPLRPAYIHLLKAFAGRQMDVVMQLLTSLEEVEGSMDLMARCELLELFASWGSREDTFLILERVKEEKRLSVQLFGRVISACTKAGKIDEAIFWFDEMQRAGVKPDTMAWNSIIHGCARSGRSAEAEMWLGEMEASGMMPDVWSYNTVINVCAHDGRPQEAQRWLAQMQEAGVQPDAVTYATTISALTKAKMVDEAIDILVQMEDLALPPNQAAYARVVTGLGRAGRAREAAAWLVQMEEAGLNPIAPVYNWVIAACKNPAQPDLAEKVLRRMLANGQMPNDFCLSTLKSILGERFTRVQAEIPQLRRAAAQVAQEKRRHQQSSREAKMSRPRPRKGRGKGHEKVITTPP